MTGNYFNKRVEEDCIESIERLLAESYHVRPKMKPVFRRVKSRYSISTRALRKLWKHYAYWSEVPAITREKVRRFRRLSRKWRRTRVINDTIVNALQSIVDDNPELYLDEIVEELVKISGVYLSLKTIWTALHDKCGYSLQVCCDRVK